MYLFIYLCIYLLTKFSLTVPFVYKNKDYKHIETKIVPKIKHVLRGHSCKLDYFTVAS